MKKTMTRNQRRRHKLIEQRVIGGIMVLMGALAVWIMAKSGEDCTGGLLFGGVGLFLVLNHRICIY